MSQEPSVLPRCRISMPFSIVAPTTGEATPCFSAIAATRFGQAVEMRMREGPSWQAHQHHEEVQRVHLRRDLRRLRRKQREVRHPLDEKLPDYWTDVRHSVIRSPLRLSVPLLSRARVPADNPSEASRS